MAGCGCIAVTVRMFPCYIIFYGYYKQGGFSASYHGDLSPCSYRVSLISYLTSLSFYDSFVVYFSFYSAVVTASWNRSHL